jgi:hypothetical protein
MNNGAHSKESVAAVYDRRHNGNEAHALACRGPRPTGHNLPNPILNRYSARLGRSLGLAFWLTIPAPCGFLLAWPESAPATSGWPAATNPATVHEAASQETKMQDVTFLGTQRHSQSIKRLEQNNMYGFGTGKSHH